MRMLTLQSSDCYSNCRKMAREKTVTDSG
jgi:hypothetical protein